MGTKVEGKTYFPGYFAMADSSVNSNSNWLSYHEENKPSGHVSDSFTIIAGNGYVDKESLKRTMLVHDATFRQQVYELHRLYKTQRDLMAHLQREECNGYARSADTLQARSYSSQAPSVDVKRVWQVLPPISGHDIKQSSVNFVKGIGSDYSMNGTPLRHNNGPIGRSTKKMLDLQLPADAYADDGDDDVEILEEKPAKILPRTNGSVLGGNVTLNPRNIEGSSPMEKSWITGLHPRQSSAVNILNKAVEESSSMKMTDFLGVGTSTSQNQRYSSGVVNLNLLSMEDTMKQKRVGEASGSNFFGANTEIRNGNSFSYKKDYQNVNMAWFKQEQSGINSSAVHYLPSCSTFNQPTLAPPSSNAALKSLWQSSNASYTTNSHYGSVEIPFPQNGSFNGFSANSVHAPIATHYRNHHSSKIPEEPQHRKNFPLHGVNLNDTPQDVTDIQEQGSESSPIDISWLRKKPVDLMKPQVPLNCANGHSQVLLGSTAYSEGATRILGIPINAAAEKDPRCSSALHIGTKIEPSTNCDADIEIQFQNKKDDKNVRDLFDLNMTLPLMDDQEIDAHQLEENTVPKELDYPSKESLTIAAAESLLAMCKDVFQEGSPQADTLHWFAGLATASMDDTMVYSTESDSDVDFEALTLQLEETKSYEHHSTPTTAQEHKNNDDYGSAVASLLQTKPRRGQARKRRQKKDFQKDILPSLASLSKHEVSEDLQTLGWSTPTKRGGRNGSQPRGRRRARSLAVTVEEAEVSPPPVPPPPAPADLDADALGITGWGRTTRRCRRPRCPPVVNNASLRLA